MVAGLVVLTILLFLVLDFGAEKARRPARVRPDGMFWSESLGGFTMADGGELIDDEKNKGD